MKFENCFNCKHSKWTSHRGLHLFRRDDDYETVYCTVLYQEISPKDYHFIDNAGCGSFEANLPLVDEKNDV